MRRYRTYPFSGGATRHNAAVLGDRESGTGLHRKASAAARVLLSAAVVFVVAAPLSASAVPVTDRFDASAVQRVVAGSNSDVTAVLHEAAPSVSRDGTMAATVVVTNKHSLPLNYLEVRLRLRTPGGRLLYQRTQVLNEATGTVAFDFERSLDDLTSANAEGHYRLQVRVFTSGTDPIELEDRVLVFDPTRAVVPLVVVARLSGAPMTDPAGHFVVDPAVDTATRDAAVSLADALKGSPASRISLAIPPYLLDDWLRASAGYTVVTTSGLRTVPPTAPAAIAYGSALKTVAGLVRDPRIELLDVPFGDPDLPALVRIKAVKDLPEHYARALSSYRATIDALPSAGTAALCESFPQTTLPTLVKRSIDHVLLDPASLARTEATGTGPVHLRGSSVTGLIIDQVASASLATATADPKLLIDQLFEHHSAESTSGVVVVVVPLGQGASVDAQELVSTIAEVATTGWVRPLTAAQASSSSTTLTAALASKIVEPAAAPTGYWASVSRARLHAAAYLEAAGADDPDARAAATQALLAQSRSWAGPLQDWSLASRGRAYADAAVKGTRAAFDKVSVQVSDVTLSGTSGRIPVTIHNSSSKVLRIKVVATSPSLAFPSGAGQALTLEPGESFLTIPVNLSRALSGKVKIAARSGSVQLAAASLTVRASFIDRLVIVGGIVVVLVVLLFLIRRRVKKYQASANRSGADSAGAHRAARKDGVS